MEKGSDVRLWRPIIKFDQNFAGQLCVIVEYCKYGNLRDFLLKNRNNFIDQIDRKTDQIDPSITDFR